MKSTGIVRRVDELGRIVLPAELRRTLDISVKDQMEIFVDGNAVVLKKYAPTCIFCDSAKDVSVFRGKNVCSGCIRSLKGLSPACRPGAAAIHFPPVRIGNPARRPPPVLQRAAGYATISHCEF